MLRLLSFKAKKRKDFGKLFKPCHVGIHWKALAERYQMYPCARVSIIFQVLIIKAIFQVLIIKAIFRRYLKKNY